MNELNYYGMNSGRMIKEDGTVVNIADELAGDAEPIERVKGYINSYRPTSGRFIREDGTVINIADLIASGKFGGGSVTPEQIQQAVDAYLEEYRISAEILQVDHGTQNTTFTLPPNQYHTWGEVPSLTIILGTGVSGVVNVYWFSFDSGDTATTLSLPDTVQTDIVVEPNMHYECSIVGNYMTFSEWEVSA